MSNQLKDFEAEDPLNTEMKTTFRRKTLE